MVNNIVVYCIIPIDIIEINLSSCAVAQMCLSMAMMY